MLRIGALVLSLTTLMLVGASSAGRLLLQDLSPGNQGAENCSVPAVSEEVNDVPPITRENRCMIGIVTANDPICTSPAPFTDDGILVNGKMVVICYFLVFLIQRMPCLLAVEGTCYR
jgi:hypothetical protein